MMSELFTMTALDEFFRSQAAQSISSSSTVDADTKDKKTTKSNKTRSCESLCDDNKALKKKLKKERQKEKKVEKLKSTEVRDSSVNKKEKSSKKDAEKISKKVHEEDENSISEIDEDKDGIDVDYAEETSAFIESIKDAKIKKSITKTPIKPTTSALPIHHRSLPDVSIDVTPIKKVKRQVQPKMESNEAKKPKIHHGNAAIKSIFTGNYEAAISHLTHIMSLFPTDFRHYRNRIYCYLRTKDYSRALIDILYLKDHMYKADQLSEAICREGQALCGLQKYEEAERAFRTSIELADNINAKRELKRTQIMRIVNMGFREQDAILALQQREYTQEAIALLIEQENRDFDTDDSEGNEDEDIFYSDTEDCPSNERILSNMLNFDVKSAIHEQFDSIIECPSSTAAAASTSYIANSTGASSTAWSQRMTNLRIKKAFPERPKIVDPDIDNTGVFIGYLTPQITDEMLIKKFGSFGKVTSIWRDPNGSYGFIYFQSTTAVEKVLAKVALTDGDMDVNGSIISVKYKCKKKNK